MLDRVDRSVLSRPGHDFDESNVAEIRAKLVSGGTLPYEWYTDPAIFKLERDRIFRKTWQFVGFTFDIPNPGDVKPIELAGMPLVLARNQDNQIRALVNVCRHRGYDLVRECSNRNTLKCVYHGWVYDLDGNLREAPRSELEDHFDKARHPLQQMRIETYGPMMFVNLDPDALPLRDWLGVSGEAMDQSGVDFDSARLHRTSVTHLKGNWKAFAENTNECYHCPVAHPTIGNMYQIGPDDYQQKLLMSGMLTSIPMQELSFASGMRRWPYVFPNHKIYPFVDKVGSGFNIAYWTAISPTETVATLHNLFSPDTPLEHCDRLADFANLIFAEDVGLVEGVQRGMAAEHYSRGGYMAKSEYGLQHIGKLTFAALTGDYSVVELN